MRKRKRKQDRKAKEARRIAAANPVLGDLYLEGYKAGIREGVDIGIEECLKALRGKLR